MWKSGLWREKRFSKLVFLLNIPSQVGPWCVSSNAGYSMTSSMVEQSLLGRVGLTPTLSSALVFWTFSRLVSSAEAESFLCLIWQFLSLIQPMVYIFFYNSLGPQATPPPYIYSGRSNLSKSSIVVNSPRTSYHPCPWWQDGQWTDTSPASSAAGSAACFPSGEPNWAPRTGVFRYVYIFTD